MSQRWSRRAKLVMVRFALVGGAVLAWGALAWLTISVQAGSTTAVSSGSGRPTVVTQSTTTIYQESPGAVGLILVVLAAAVVMATSSVIWRVVRHSERIGITGMVVAVLVGGMALLGMLTVGMFIVPLAVLLVLLALPIAPERAALPLPLGVPAPGWYGDPSGGASLRYWDGRAWTVQTAPTPAPWRAEPTEWGCRGAAVCPAAGPQFRRRPHELVSGNVDMNVKVARRTGSGVAPIGNRTGHRSAFRRRVGR